MGPVRFLQDRPLPCRSARGTRSCSERSLKTDGEEASFMMTVGLITAVFLKNSPHDFNCHCLSAARSLSLKFAEIDLGAVF